MSLNTVNLLEVTNLLLTTNNLQVTNQLVPADTSSFGFELEDGSGVILLEDGSILQKES